MRLRDLVYHFGAPHLATVEIMLSLKLRLKLRMQKRSKVVSHSNLGFFLFFFLFRRIQVGTTIKLT